MIGLFFAGNTYLDFEDKIQFAVKTMRAVNISDDSDDDDNDDDDAGSEPDVDKVAPALSKIQLNEQVGSTKSDSDGNDSDSDVEILDAPHYDRNGSPELVAPAIQPVQRSPAHLVGLSFFSSFFYHD